MGLITVKKKKMKGLMLYIEQKVLAVMKKYESSCEKNKGLMVMKKRDYLTKNKKV